MKILFVEDQETFARIVVDQFMPSDEVVISPSLADARNKLVGAKFEAILVDYDLQDGKGDELVRELRQSGDSTLIIGVSSHEAGNEALSHAGANNICKKAEFAKIQERLHS